MKIYKESDNDKVEIIKPYEESNDKGLVKSPNNPNVATKIPDEVKEIIAIDALDLGVREAAKIHGIGKTTAANIANNSVAKAEVVATRYDIQNLATAKLMQTLGLLNPHDVEKETDRVAIMTGLSKVISVIDKDTKDKKEGRSVHLHLYAPNQRKEDSYETIEVGGVVS
jgi:hypothetical protein